jgi:hypothetical protein
MVPALLRRDFFLGAAIAGASGGVRESILCGWVSEWVSVSGVKVQQWENCAWVIRCQRVEEWVWVRECELREWVSGWVMNARWINMKVRPGEKQEEEEEWKKDQTTQKVLVFLRIEPQVGSGGIGQPHGVGQRIKAIFSVSKSLCRKKI